MDALRAKFLKLYADLPSAVREEIVVVIDDEPYTWNAVNVEVNAETEKSDRILSQLDELGII